MPELRLPSEPVLGTMVLSVGGVWDYTYRLASGLVFPEGTEAHVTVTDRAGAELGVFEGETILNTIRFLAQPGETDDIVDGANFEMIVEMPDGPYKVLYGRVSRRQVSYPLNPVNSSVYTAALYTDSVGLRDTLGPFWVQKSGKTVMHDNTGASKPYGMGNDFILFDSSAVHWYAPLKSDSQKVQVSLMKPPLFGGGELVVVLCSNYGMTNWIGVKFDCGANTVRPVTGSTGGPTAYINQSTTVSNGVATSPDTYTTWFDYPTNTIKLFKGASATPLLTWTDSTNVCGHGEGHRYTGLIYKGALLSVGPQVSYWSAKDDL